MRKLAWEKVFVVYHVRSRAYHKAFDLESAAKRSVTCANRNVGVPVYEYTTRKNYWENVASKLS